MTFFSSPSKISLNKSISCDLSKCPKIFWATLKLSSSFSFKLNKALSNKDSASLTDPSDILTINLRASSETRPFPYLLRL